MQPQQLGKYQFEQFLGGGMSHVYKARDTLINRTVVVKILTESGLMDEDAKKRFLREAQTAGSISHENIVRVYDFGEHEGRPYMVMEYLQGNDLRAGIQQNQLPAVIDKLKVLLQLARAMEHIHTLGIVHRDLKPDNVFLSQSGTVKLMDFGIAKTKDLSITRTGYTLGTPYYMAPEQVTSKDVTEKADLYAFGIVMFELFTGTKPFKAENVHEVFFKILNEPLDVAPLTELKVPPRIVDLVKRLTAKDQTQRPADFAVIVKELETAVRQLENSDGDTISKPVEPKKELSKPLLAAGALALVAVIGFLVYSFLPRPTTPVTPKKTGPVTTVTDLAEEIQTATGPMVLVREGDFVYSEANETRPLKSFYIDKYEVTNELYAKFARDREWPLPKNFPTGEADAKLPVVNVTFNDAREFAIWAGKRLPYAAEWEKAARGPKGRPYPWGYEHLPEMAVVADNPKLKGKLKGPMAVGSWPDSNSTYQAMDLAGNVMEWVDEKVDPSKASLQTIGKLVTPPAAADELWVQLRGGSFFNELLKNASFEFIRAPARFSSPDVGFRCVVDATVKPK